MNYILAILTLVLSACAQVPGHPHSTRQKDLIEKAGNTSVEADRYASLVELSKLPDLDEQLHLDLDTLLPAVDVWANERSNWDPANSRRQNRFLSGYILDEWPPAIAETSPLYPIWAMYRGRSLIQRPIQSGGIQHNPERRAKYFGEGRRLLRIANKAFPQNELVRLYLDETFQWPLMNPIDPRAPDWANLQRETLEKLSHIITWWIETRQAPDGQLGGGWGDDVEIWRTWAPVLVGFEDPVAIRGQTNIAEGLFAAEHMKGGYTSYMTDVEHTGEDSGDTCTSMMHLRPDDPVWQARAQRIFELFRDLWTDRNARNQLQFRSTYFTSGEVDTTSQRACDTVYHPRAVQPALLYWQRTADPEMTALFSDWMRTWVAAAAGTQRGKPAGIIPSAIHWPSGTVGGLGKNWWDPQNHGESKLYLWPSAMSMMTNSLLLTSHMTGDPGFLEPVRTMARARERYLANPTEDPTPGSEAWCASKMGIAETLAKYRLLTGDTEFDPLLLQDANGYVRYRMTGNREHLVKGLDRTAIPFRINRASYMEEVRWTDRQLSFNRNYANYYAEPKLQSPTLSALYGAVTGDFGDALYFPMNAVKWKTHARDIGALVNEAGSDVFSAELYHFGEASRDMGAELYLLDAGSYDLVVTNTVSAISETQVVEVTGPRTQISFVLSSRNLYTITLRKKV